MKVNGAAQGFTTRFKQPTLVFSKKNMQISAVGNQCMMITFFSFTHHFLPLALKAWQSISGSVNILKFIYKFVRNYWCSVL